MLAPSRQHSVRLFVEASRSLTHSRETSVLRRRSAERPLWRRSNDDLIAATSCAPQQLRVCKKRALVCSAIRLRLASTLMSGNMCASVCARRRKTSSMTAIERRCCRALSDERETELGRCDPDLLSHKRADVRPLNVGARVLESRANSPQHNTTRHKLCECVCVLSISPQTMIRKPRTIRTLYT